VCLGWEKIPIKKVRRPSLIADFTPAIETQPNFCALHEKKFRIVNLISCFGGDFVNGVAGNLRVLTLET
jgi:hypothetical protein